MEIVEKSEGFQLCRADWFVGNAKAMALYLQIPEEYQRVVKTPRLYWPFVISTNRLVILLSVAREDNSFRRARVARLSISEPAGWIRLFTDHPGWCVHTARDTYFLDSRHTWISFV